MAAQDPSRPTDERPPMSRTPTEPVHVVLSACGPKYTSQAIRSIFSIHQSVKTYGFECLIHVLHGTDTAAIHMLRVLTDVKSANITALRFHFVRLNTSSFKNLFKPCSMARLQMASLLPRVELAVYVDADVYVDDDLSELRALSARFSSSQWAALADEAVAVGNEAAVSRRQQRSWWEWATQNFEERVLRKRHKAPARQYTWYTLGNTKGPYVKPNGLNAGVMLVNLTRWRQSNFDKFWNNYRGDTPLGDQDILNAYFATRLDELSILPCKWNRRVDSNCDSPIQPSHNGIWHGNRQAFTVNETRKNLRDYFWGRARGKQFERMQETTKVFLSLGRFASMAG